MASARVTLVLGVCLWLGSVGAEAKAKAEANGGGVVRKGEGAPWGHYFSPGFGGYYSADDFRIEPQTVHIHGRPAPYESFESNLDDEQQIIQGPDYSQATQGPDYGQVTQGPDYGQVTQGPDYSQVTQGPDYGQVTERPSVQQTQGPFVPDYHVTTYHPKPEIPDAQSTNYPDDQQYTTPLPTDTYPTTHQHHYHTTSYPTTTDYPEHTTWRPHIPEPSGTCHPNPAAAGYPRGTKLLCTVELCGGSGIKGGGGIKGGRGIKGGVKNSGRIGLGIGIDLGIHIGGRSGYAAAGHGLTTTLVCRPFPGCDEVSVQTTEPSVYTTIETHYTTAAPTEHAYTTPGYTTPGHTIPPVEETPIPHITPQPGVKGGHHRGDVGVKGGHQSTFWEVETLTQSPELEGIKGIKRGRRPSISYNIPPYSQWGLRTLDKQIGVKGGFSRIPVPVGVKGGYQHDLKGGYQHDLKGGYQHELKGGRRRVYSGGYSQGGWASQVYQDPQAGLYIR